MSKSIKLHPKHGLNPSLEICYICGEDKDTIIMLGAAYKGEAPHRMCVNREPCEACVEHMRQGVIFISVKDGQPESDNPYRTGKFAVVTENAVKRIVQPGVLQDHILKARVAFIEDQTWAMIGLPTTSEGNNQ